MDAASQQLVNAEQIARLKWRCRRGLLENDLIIEAFFARFAQTLTQSQVTGLEKMMELSDPDLLDLLLNRTQPQGHLCTPEVLMVLSQLQIPQRKNPAAV